MLTQAILIGLVAMCVTFEWALGTCLASRPIVTGVLIGLVMGDLQTGIIVGATLEWCSLDRLPSGRPFRLTLSPVVFWALPLQFRRVKALKLR